MLRKVATLWLMALIVVPFANANPASAKPSDDAHVSVGNRWQAIATSLCADSYGFNYMQRITIDGESAMRPVVSVAPPGHYKAFLSNSCDGYDIYEFGSCLCQIVAVRSSP